MDNDKITRHVKTGNSRALNREEVRQLDKWMEANRKACESLCVDELCDLYKEASGVDVSPCTVRKGIKLIYPDIKIVRKMTVKQPGGKPGGGKLLGMIHNIDGRLQLLEALPIDILIAKFKDLDKRLRVMEEALK